MRRLDDDWDVLIVGAGPAGSGAALGAARFGAKTLLIDKKREIGTPVQCGEVVGKSLLDDLGIELPTVAVCARQSYTRFIIDRRLRVSNYSDYWASVTVERKMLDKHLAHMAAMAGASVQADTRLISLEMDDDVVKSVEIMHRGRRTVVYPKVVVAADGVHSTISRLMGVRFYPEDAVAKGIEFEMTSLRKLPPCMQIFLEPEIGLGYGWIIPKGEYRANVGMGTVDSGILGKEKGRRAKLLEWIEENPVVRTYFDPDRILEVKSGEAPIPGYRGGPVKGNVLFAGDSAGQTLAFVGEGIIPSFACGGIAGGVAARSVSMNDPTVLGTYDRLLDEGIGGELQLGADIKDLIERTWMRYDLSRSQKVTVCGLLMSGCIDPQTVSMVTRDNFEELSDLDYLRDRIAEVEGNIRISPIKGH